jgi:hypothetical protein
MASKLATDVKKGLPDGFPVLEAKAGEDLTVTVDVNDMAYPYSVAFDGTTIIFGFTDRKEIVSNLQPGVHGLGWGFAHGVKGWKHEIQAQVAKKKAVTLESRSEAKKDKPYSSSFAFVVVE